VDHSILHIASIDIEIDSIRIPFGERWKTREAREADPCLFVCDGSEMVIDLFSYDGFHANRMELRPGILVEKTIFMNQPEGDLRIGEA